MPDIFFLIYFAIEIWRSDMNEEITILHPVRKFMHCWKAMNSMAGLLPATFL